MGHAPAPLRLAAVLSSDFAVARQSVVGRHALIPHSGHASAATFDGAHSAIHASHSSGQVQQVPAASKGL